MDSYFGVVKVECMWRGDLCCVFRKFGVKVVVVWKFRFGIVGYRIELRVL